MTAPVSADGASIQLRFDRGTLLVEGPFEGLLDETTLDSSRLLFDDRVQAHRALASGYRAIALALHRLGVPFLDAARGFEPQPFALTRSIVARSHQKRALAAWLGSGKFGTVVLPTGAGKTILAVLAIAKVGRPTLVHVPTIDLMHQWYGVLKSHFGLEPGLLGGGYHEIRPLTVATYDSALLHVTTYGNRFGFHVYDECHHLPGPQTRLVAVQSIAPFRLGLTTPDRQDGKHDDYRDLCGPVCFEITVNELEGHTLAPYDVITVSVPLSDNELARYQEAREKYVAFLRTTNVDFSRPSGWNDFLRLASRSPKGREALVAYREQRSIGLAAGKKEDILWGLLRRHAGERVIVFTQENAMAYRIGERFLLPVLTHHTKVKEREDMLVSFRAGHYSALVTSKVLNEGVDVPEASVAVVVSGSGTVREHVQRLGRILRAQPGKRAVLYELDSAETSERYVNERRKQHSAYQRSSAHEAP